MSEEPVLGCALNLSEGRRPDVIQLTADQAASAAFVLDVSADPDHNRTVLTLCGHPEGLVEAVLRLTRVALEHIDLTGHSGVHPRTGVVDVVPFYPLRTAPLAAAEAAAEDCAHRLWEELGLPVFLYEHSAPTAQARALPWIRQHAFVDHLPDLGGPDPHPTGGAAVVGARGLLVAYNVDLATDDLGVARKIAGTVRMKHAGYLRTLGLYLPSRGAAQVSMNILKPESFTLLDAYRAVAAEAERACVKIQGSEVVGIVPRASLDFAEVESLGLRKPPKVLEDILERLLAD